MPRHGVHATRDLQALRPELLARGILPGPAFEAAIRDRHEAIDRDLSMGGAPMHFMRGHDEEDAPSAVVKALRFARARAWRAVEALARALERPPAAEDRALPEALADALHVVRDSYSSGHAVRRPRGTGPVVALRAWELDRKAGRGFGLRHVLLHDLRFEWPFRLRAREVPASDAAVGEAVRLILDAAEAPPSRRAAVFERDWRAFVEERFLPPDLPWPDEAEDLPEPEASA